MIVLLFFKAFGNVYKNGKEKSNSGLVFIDNLLGLFFPSHNFLRSIDNIGFNVVFESECKKLAKKLSVKEFCEIQLEEMNNMTKRIEYLKANPNTNITTIRYAIDNLKDIHTRLACCQTNAGK